MNRSHTFTYSRSHTQSYYNIALEHDMEPSEVEAMSNHFGNDFDSLSTALDSLEQVDIYGLPDDQTNEF